MPGKRDVKVLTEILDLATFFSLSAIAPNKCY